MEKRVLLIDDKASLRRSVTMGLMQKGYQTESCENGMKGLQALDTHKQRQMPLKGAVVDVQLPDIDGLKLLKIIKFNYPQLPVIVITGYGNDAIAEEARRPMPIWRSLSIQRISRACSTRSRRKPGMLRQKPQRKTRR